MNVILVMIKTAAVDWPLGIFSSRAKAEEAIKLLKINFPIYHELEIDGTLKFTNQKTPKTVVYKKNISFFGQIVQLCCDAKCNKAWGTQERPRIQLSDNIDDFCWLADDELPEAPVNPGTSEGGHLKPINAQEEDMNKWCTRQCERAKILVKGEKIELRDFSKRIYNIPREDE